MLSIHRRIRLSYWRNPFRSGHQPEVKPEVVLRSVVQVEAESGDKAHSLCRIEKEPRPDGNARARSPRITRYRKASTRPPRRRRLITWSGATPDA